MRPGKREQEDLSDPIARGDDDNTESAGLRAGGLK
jgi:hypothetical protein